MGKRKSGKEHSRNVDKSLYNNDTESYFFMIATDFLEAAQVHDLSYRQFYLLMCCHAYQKTTEHGDRLYKEFERYFRGIGEAKTKEELKLYAGKAGRSQKTFNHEYFIFPPDASEKLYGLKHRNHVTEDLKILEVKGFIRTFYKPLGKKYGDEFKKAQTIYEFTDTWKLTGY